jgi:acid phosphatase
VRRTLLAALGVLAVLTSCSSSGTTSSSPSPATPTTPATRLATPPTQGGGTTTPALPSKVLVVVLENHSLDTAWRQMPYLRSLGTRYGRTTAYRALTHPSLPNYLAIAGGSTFGIRDDKNPPAHHLGGATVFGQALSHHRTARTYAEGMTRLCMQASTGRYAVRHNPWAYFTDAAERSGCSRDDVSTGTTASGALRDDTLAGRLPNVGLVVPDVCDDGHDCSLALSDRWLRGWMGLVTSGPDFRAGRLAVVVTFDEDDRTQSNTVLTVVVHPRLQGLVVRTQLSHLDLSAWLSRVAGATPLRNAAGHRSLGRSLGLATA